MKMTILNIKKNNPSCNEALALVENEIEILAFQKEIDVLKIIHGYGSSGIGGEIKNKLKTKLEFLKKQKKILSYCPSEKFCNLWKDYSIFIKKFPELSIDYDIKNQNPGTTLIFLKK